MPAGGSKEGAAAGGVDGRPLGELAEVAVVPEFNAKNSEFGKMFPAGGVNAGDPKMKQKKTWEINNLLYNIIKILIKIIDEQIKLLKNFINFINFLLNKNFHTHTRTLY